VQIFYHALRIQHGYWRTEVGATDETRRIPIGPKKLGHSFTACNFRNVDQIGTEFGTIALHFRTGLT